MPTGTAIIRPNAAGERRLHRRTMLAGAASVAAAGFATRLGQPSPTKAQDGKATFVLVPGQWTGAFVWRTVAPLLRAAGHDVYAVTCTGLGDRVHLASPAIDLDTFITDVANVLEYQDLHDVILVGHSFGGMVITGVAERVPERLAQLVYLDASVPADGQNDYNIDYSSEDAYDEGIAADIAAAMEAGLPGFVPVFPWVGEWLQGAITDPAEAEWFIAKLVPHPQLTKLQPVRLGNPAAAALPHVFIMCTEDAFESSISTVERVRSDPTWRVVELADNHLAPLNSPELTAEALLAVL